VDRTARQWHHPLDVVCQHVAEVRLPSLHRAVEWAGLTACLYEGIYLPSPLPAYLLQHLLGPI